MRPPLAALCTLAAAALFAPAAGASEPYTRISEQPDGQIVLEMCTRSFTPENADAPRVHMVSAIHIGDRSYYRAMQELLETYDTVLFEGIKPAGLDPIDPGLSDEAKARATRERLALLVQVARQTHQSGSGIPEGLSALRGSGDKRIASIVDSIDTDAWGRGIVSELSREYEVRDGVEEQVVWELSFTSLGADGVEGGEGVNADIVESTGAVVGAESDAPSPEGIQDQLARALRVSFQLDEMDTTNPAWVNADMDVNELQRALSEYGEDSSQLLAMLEGESFTARIAGFVLGFVARSPQLSSMMKLMIMDMLEIAERTDLLSQQMDATYAVIVDGRNEVVIEDLIETINAHPEYEDIAIFYGAGHMVGLEASLIEMGYAPSADRWEAAMTVNPEDTGLSAAQVKMMRNMMKSSLQQQLGK